MGNSISSWGGKKKVQSLINSAGLPLQIDDDSPEEQNKGPLSPYTEAYPAKGWFTGVRSKVTIKKPPAVVYKSLSKDLHKVFSPMSECDDEIKEEDGQGRQVIFRVVRIPFKVAFVTGNLKLRLHVDQDSSTGKIHFQSVQAGRLITEFIADFEILQDEGQDHQTVVSLDAKINAQSLPPAPFKGMVKDLMVRKMDSCMVDLVEFHSRGDGDAGQQRVLADGRAPSAPLPRRGSQGVLASLRKSLGRRPSVERRASLDRAASAAAMTDGQFAPEKRRNLDLRKSFDKLNWQKSFLRQKSSKQSKAEPKDTSGGQAAVFAAFQERTRTTV